MESLAAVMSQLEALRSPTLDKTEARLSQVRGFLRARQVAAEMAPDVFARWDAAHPTIYPRQLLDAGLSAEVAEILTESMERLFPINDFWLEELIESCEDGQLPIIPIQPCNLISNWDEFDEVLDNPEQIEADGAVTYLAFLLAFSVTDAGIWQAAARHFGWPDELSAPPKAARGGVYLDSEAFFSALEAAGLHEFLAPFKMSLFETGSRFLDLDDEQVITNPIEFSPDTVRLLTQEWQLAEQILHDADLAAVRARQNSGLYLEILQLYDAALRGRDDKEVMDDTTTEYDEYDADDAE